MKALALFYVLFMASPALALDGQQRLLGVWKLESWYSEFKTTGAKENFYGERPNGYLIFIFTPEKSGRQTLPHQDSLPRRNCGPERDLPPRSRAEG